MSKGRFVPIAEVVRLMKVIEEAKSQILSFNSWHCKKCGDTAPKHGYYPLFGGISGIGFYETSSLTCNRCALTDSDYIATFGEPKEMIVE